mgnify:CR=1 FL=1
MIRNITTEIAARLRLPQGINSFNTSNELSINDLSPLPGCPPSPNQYICGGGETLHWTDLRLDPNESITLTLAPIVDESSLWTAGVDSLLPFNLEVFGTDEKTLLSGTTTIGELESPGADVSELELRLDEDAHPVSPGSFLTYTVHFGNQTATTLTQKQLLAIPETVDFDSASDMGMLNSEGLVEWPATAVSPQKGITRTVVVEVTEVENSPGSQLRAEARAIVLDGGEPSAGRQTRATAQTPVGTAPLDPPLTLSVVAPASAAQNEQINVDVAVTNTGATTISNVSVRVRLPQYLDNFNTSALSRPALCGPSPNQLICAAGEIVIFDDISLDAAETVTFTIPPIISDGSSGAPYGSLMTLLAEVVIIDGPLPVPHAADTVLICTGSGCP